LSVDRVYKNRRFSDLQAKAINKVDLLKTWPISESSIYHIDSLSFGSNLRWSYNFYKSKDEQNLNYRITFTKPSRVDWISK